MSDKKNIDRLFQEKFKDFDVMPDDAMWTRISDELHNKKKKRRVIPIWWRVAGVAAILALLFTIGNAVFNTTESDTLPVVDTNNPERQNNGNDTDSKQGKDSSEDTSIFDHSTTDEVASEDENKDYINTSENSNESNKDGIKKKSNSIIKEKDNFGDAVVKTDSDNRVKNRNNSQLINNQKQKGETLASNNKRNSADTNTKLSTKTEAEMKDLIKSSQNKENATVLLDPKNTENTNTTKTDSLNNDAIISEKDLVKDQSIEDAIAEQSENINEKEKETELNRWSISPNVAPVYFSSFGQGSSIHSQFNQNSKDSDINMSYGINGSYAINDRLKVRAGIHRVDLSYATNNVLVFTGADAQARGSSSQIENISFRGNEQALSIISSETLNRSSIPELVNTKFEGALDQRLGFVEVPLEMEYRLVDKKLGVNLIGGFSTFFLNKNEIYADIEGNSTLIGEANNVNSTSYSANFGVGIDYGISKRFNIHLEPTFKYQINTFNNTTGDFQPFFIGVYTGLSFKF